MCGFVLEFEFWKLEVGFVVGVLFVWYGIEVYLYLDFCVVGVLYILGLLV